MDRKEWDQLEAFYTALEKICKQAHVPLHDHEPGETVLCHLHKDMDSHDTVDLVRTLWLTARDNPLHLYVEGVYGRPYRGRVYSVEHTFDDDDLIMQLQTGSNPDLPIPIKPKNVWIQNGSILNLAIVIEGQHTPISAPVYVLTQPATRIGSDRRLRLNLAQLVYHLPAMEQMQQESGDDEFVLRRG